MLIVWEKWKKSILKWLHFPKTDNATDSSCPCSTDGVVQRQNPLLFFTGIEIGSEILEENYCLYHMPAGVSLCNKWDKFKAQLFPEHEHCLWALLGAQQERGSAGEPWLDLSRTGGVIHSRSQSPGLSPSSQENLRLHLPCACCVQQKGRGLAGKDPHVSSCHALGTPAKQSSSP